MSNSKTKTDLSAAFATLRRRFEQSLPERLARMLQLMESATADDLSELIAEAHKLAGACGTFGHAGLGSNARYIEQLAKEIQTKPADEGLQALPGLQQAVLEFDIAVDRALQEAPKAELEGTAQLHQSDTVWLLLPEQKLSTELVSQLHAFGHKVECFSDYDSCVVRLQDAAPAVLFAANKLPDGASLFEQTLLLQQLKKQQSRLLVLSDSDDFDLRIKASQHQADAFFVSPLDVPNMISTISELLEYGNKRAGRVFIVDDDRLLAQHYALVLNAAGIETHIVENVRSIVNELMRFQPDLLLMDMYMPDYSGAELAGLIRQYKSLKRLPIVFLSSEINKALQLSAMAQGADDFITKPIGDTQLVQAVKNRLKRSLQLKNLIEKDSLTALIKHSSIKEAAELEFVRSQRYKKPFSIVMLDIDLFKAVNDSYGHGTGDIVITALATLLRKRIRKTDRAGRYGGEEFMLVLPECSRVQAVELAEQILQAFRQLHFTAADKLFSCTYSAGVAASDDGDFSNAEQMIEAADAALYKAKRAGRNRVC
ncbi:diguanylate cyclase [Rheinheimera maricola]|uniref:diguanylate cyclase n=1 Tax=Rheinheimera maricola TaxID=2793282 RepID=A0ABS7XBP5_9GAMM|nr:diguanylate cyclase [Rheinheimera maricola]MBZ9612970.1 diguanylate cyclase [Rheinheimera maricola]